MLKIFSKICAFVSALFFIAGIAILSTHAYHGDKFFSAVHGMEHPASKFYKPKSKEISVMLVSDSGSNNYVLKHVIDAAKKSGVNYDFVMYMGDLAETGSITGYYWMLDEIKPNLGEMPLFAIPGNHDIIRREGIVRKEKMDQTFYKTVMGPGYYWFGYGDVLFIATDSSTGYIDDEQYEWLQNTLQKIRPLFKHCILLSHKPPINTRPDFFKDHTLKPEGKERLEHIARKYDIDAMFFGHVHFFSKAKWANTPIYTTPASGQKIRDTEHPQYGYIELIIDKHGIKSVTPRYVEFDGPKKNAVKEWWVRDILSVKVKDCVNMTVYGFGIFLLIALILNTIDKRKKH